MPENPRVISVDASGNVQSVEDIGAREARQRLSQLAWLLDSSIPIPGTRLTIGVEALIGLFPLIGDLIGVLISSYILQEAARQGAPRIVLLRMALNIGVEGVVGVVPVVGDVFDAAWKANQRNVRLLSTWLDRPAKTERSSRLFGLALGLAVAAFLALLGVAAFLLLRWIIGLL
jgi:hypothetical protein